MSRRVITWVDNEGRYRMTSPAYGDATRPAGESDDKFIQRIIGKLKAQYGLKRNHKFHLVENEAQITRVAECGGTVFRYGSDGGGQSGAWEMDDDGRPKVNIVKARIVQMDRIRTVRDAELVKLDLPFMRAVEVADAEEQERIAAQKQGLRDIPETFSLEGFDTPESLNGAWPEELSN